VNTSGESSKSGVDPNELGKLAEEVSALPRLALRGLMAIPAPSRDTSTQHRAFARVRELFEQTRAVAPGMDTLSMGMSSDLEAAVAEGATILRPGTAIFGPRER
jgi:pyridoxal phosphate enzyme (YggS family)